MNLKEPPFRKAKHNNGKKSHKHNIHNISLFMGWKESRVSQGWSFVLKFRQIYKLLG